MHCISCFSTIHSLSALPPPQVGSERIIQRVEGTCTASPCSLVKEGRCQRVRLMSGGGTGCQQAAAATIGAHTHRQSLSEAPQLALDSAHTNGRLIGQK